MCATRNVKQQIGRSTQTANQELRNILPHEVYKEMGGFHKCRCIVTEFLSGDANNGLCKPLLIIRPDKPV